MEVVLSGDVGGTHCRLALYRPGQWSQPLHMQDYSSAAHHGLEAIVELFLEQAGHAQPGRRPRRAAFGVPGPAHLPVIRMVNVPWVIDTARFSGALGLERVRFVNDFTAICLSVPHLEPSHVQAIGPGAAQAHQPIAVLGTGTGLGQGFLVWAGSRYVAVPSEGGHTDFAPRTPLEIRLLEFMLREFPRVSWERVLSGQGLPALYRFFRDGEGVPENPAVRDALAVEVPGAVITRYGLDGSDALCARVLELFCALYGAEAGNLALKVMALGGVYLAGGVTRHVLPALQRGGFRAAFEDKGRYHDFLKTVPTLAIVHPQPGLMGAAIAANEE